MKRRGFHEKTLDLLLQCIDAKNTDDALAIITNEACAYVGGKGGSIWLRDSDAPERITLRWNYRRRSPQDPTNKVGEAFYTNFVDKNGWYDGLTGWVFGTGKPLRLRDITDKKEIARHPGLKWRDKFHGYKRSAKKVRQKSFMAVPIFSTRSKTRVIGVLRVTTTLSGKQAFSQRDLTLLRLFAGHIAGLLTNYVKRQEEEKLLANLFPTPNAADIQPILDGITRAVPVVLDGSYCSIFLRGENGRFCLEATNAPSLEAQTLRSAGPDRCLHYGEGEGKTGRVASTGQPVSESGDIKSRAKSSNLCETSEPGAFLAVPIRQQDDVVIGIIRVVRAIGQGGAFDQSDIDFLTTCAARLLAILSFWGLTGRGSCFVIMPFSDGMRRVFSSVIRPTLEAQGFSCRTEEDYHAPGHLTHSILDHISRAQLVVAEISDKNPNVFYELGIAHALKKTVILLTQNDAPFDVKHFRYYTYQDRISGDDELRKKLTDAIRAGLREGMFGVRY